MITDQTRIWLPLYTGDFLAETSRMTPAQRGAYVSLMVDYWLNGPPPADDAILTRIVGAFPADWPSIKAGIQMHFREVDGCWQHGRWAQEREKAREIARNKFERASAASRARWKKGGSGARASNAALNTGSSAEASAYASAPRDEVHRLGPRTIPSPSQPYSVPNGTAHRASPSDEDRLAEFGSIKDPDERFWTGGVALLMERGGKTDRASRSFLGKLRRDSDLAPLAAWRLVEAAWRSGTRDPTAYLAAAASAELASRNSTQITAPDPERQRRWAAEFVEAKHRWRPERGPAPGEAGCRIDSEILAEFGLPPTPPYPDRRAG